MDGTGTGPAETAKGFLICPFKVSRKACQSFLPKHALKFDYLGVKQVVRAPNKIESLASESSRTAILNHGKMASVGTYKTSI